jgi:glycosyltransferase involved in cell wall biosynthesis
MKSLFLTVTEPDDCSFGGAIRSGHIHNAMAMAGTVHTLLIHGGPSLHIEQAWNAHGLRHITYDRHGASPQALRQRMQIRRWVAAIVRDEGYDAIVARYVGLAAFVPTELWNRLVLDADDIVKSGPIDADFGRRQRLRLWVRNVLARRMARRSAHVWFVNPSDGPALGARRMTFLRNVVRIPTEGPRAVPVPGRILMVGLFAYRPNAQGLNWFVEQVLPTLVAAFPHVELHAVGKHLPGFAEDFGAMPVRIRGYVDDLATEYDLASMVIAPIEAGGGTQIKVIDALAHGRPLVASEFAHSGFADELRATEHLLVASGAGEWVRACTQLLAEPEVAEAMAARGRAAVRVFGSDHMAETVRKTLDEVAAQAR